MLLPSMYKMQLTISCVIFHDSGPKTPVKNNEDDTTFPATVVQVSVHTASQEKDTSQNLIQYTSKSQDDCKHALLKESNSDHQSLKCGLPQPSNTKSA